MALYFAQFGDGADLFSHIILFNLDPDMEATVRMILKDNDGNPLSVNLDGELVTGEKTIMIPAGGLRSFKTDGLGDLLEGSVTVLSDKAVAGVILFGGTDRAGRGGQQCGAARRLHGPHGEPTQPQESTPGLRS